MTAPRLLFRDVHLTALSAQSIATVVRDSKRLSKPFQFLATPSAWSLLYQDMFWHQYRLRIGRDPAAPTQPRRPPRFPFVRGVGRLVPLAGHEIRNQPPYGDWGADMQHLAYYWVLPLEIRPNRRVRIHSNYIKKFKPSELRCKLLLKLYPRGGISCQLRVHFRSKNGIDLRGVVELLKVITDKPALAVGSKTYDLRRLMAELFSKVVGDLSADAISIQPADIHAIHRIVTLNETVPSIDPQLMRAELAGLIGLDAGGAALSDSFIQKYAGKVLEGKFKGQFLVFHPESTLIHLTEIPGESGPAQSPGHIDYVRSCLRENVTSVLDFALIENVIAEDLRSAVRQAIEVRDPSFDQIQELKELVERYRVLVSIFDPNEKLFWGKRVHGIHRTLLNSARGFPTWQSPIAKLLTDLSAFDSHMLDVEENAAITEIDNTIRDANVTLAQLAKKADVFGLGAAQIVSLKGEGDTIRRGLTQCVKELGEIEGRAGTIAALPTDPATKNQDELSISMFVQNFQEKFLPQYEVYVVKMVDVASSKLTGQPPAEPGKAPPASATPSSTVSPPPSSAAADLAQADGLVKQALAAKSTIQQSYGRVAAFYNAAKPYITPLVTAATLVMKFLPLL